MLYCILPSFHLLAFILLRFFFFLFLSKGGDRKVDEHRFRRRILRVHVSQHLHRRAAYQVDEPMFHSLLVDVVDHRPQLVTEQHDVVQPIALPDGRQHTLKDVAVAVRNVEQQHALAVKAKAGFGVRQSRTAQFHRVFLELSHGADFVDEGQSSVPVIESSMAEMNSQAYSRLSG